VLANACRLIAATGRILALVLLIGCGRMDADIDAVKAARSIEGMTNAQLAIDIGGERSAVTWSAEPAPAIESKDAIVVIAVINRTARAGTKHEVRLRFLHDRKSGAVSLRGVNMDGKIVDLATMSFDEFKMLLE
jgi:ribosomal protein S28E/S33